MLRIEKARRQLELTPKPVNEIAWAVGYEDPTAFRRIFLRIVGLPPGEYRKRFSVEAARQALER
ncbi:helix-turn-helix domain-containing protein [Pseudovibrio exalbescens]|uniref:helix-turn-helix domain-containing protein n=1 Tax=Pseudovibrio exalbescens TaxID=197461 RepID=UPI001F1EEDA6|nr:helix-turn-helix domain-containing protein [Pseudovibrio exalbescens]